jgi:predicted O-methyltransferase YrrM
MTMFRSIPPAMLERMRYLEARDAADRADGTPRLQRLRQISPETGKFLALLLANAPQGHILEIGTSAGYSTLWLALAAQVAGRRVTTFEVLPEKIALAGETFHLAGIDQVVDVIADDARKHIEKFNDIAFCFLDAEKEVYSEMYEMVVPRLTKGGLLVADNAINHREALQPMLDRALNDDRVDALVVPIGKGELVCRKI